MKRVSALFIVIFTLAMFNTGCSKYDENTGISLKSKVKRISQTWKIDGYVFADGSTKAPGAEEGSIEFINDGSVICHYFEGESVTGAWSFFNKKKQLNWSSEYVTDIEDVVIFDESIILKLTKDEFWLQEENGGIITKFSVK